MPESSWPIWKSQFEYRDSNQSWRIKNLTIFSNSTTQETPVWYLEFWVQIRARYWCNQHSNSAIHEILFLVNRMFEPSFSERTFLKNRRCYSKNFFRSILISGFEFLLFLKFFRILVIDFLISSFKRIKIFRESCRKLVEKLIIDSRYRIEFNFPQSTLTWTNLVVPIK